MEKEKRTFGEIKEGHSVFILSGFPTMDMNDYNFNKTELLDTDSIKLFSCKVVSRSPIFDKSYDVVTFSKDPDDNEFTSNMFNISADTDKETKIIQLHECRTIFTTKDDAIAEFRKVMLEEIGKRALQRDKIQEEIDNLTKIVESPIESKL